MTNIAFPGHISIDYGFWVLSALDLGFAEDTGAIEVMIIDID